jgi:hydroxyacylglutathione hydrolase
MGFEVVPVPMLDDNYSWALIDRDHGQMAIVDPPETAPVEELLGNQGLELTLILLTHHHADHIAGAEALRRQHNCPIYGARADQHRLPSLDRALADGDQVAFAGVEGDVFETPGHTMGHISFYFAGARALFCGDTLFSLGCGRLLEGTAAQMFASLARFETLVYCGHEYTAANGRFALTVEPENQALAARLAQVAELRAAGLPTLPAVLGDELAENPFLRAETVERLAEIRAAKDRFRG